MFYNDIFTDDSLERYIQLYSKGIDIKNIQPLSNETYKIFSRANTSIRLVNIKENYDFFTRSGKVKHFISCVRKVDIYRSIKYNIEVKDSYIYMIPIQTIKGTIVGFIFRGLYGNLKNAPKYHTTTSEVTDRIKKVPYMYGFYKDFESFDSHEYCKPIIVVEGAKDCIYIKQFYPYTLSTNTNKLGFNANILRELTDKIILCLDNDKGGKEYSQELKNLVKLGFNVSSVKLDEGIKDPCTYLKYPELEMGFQKRVLRAVEELEEV